MLGEAFTGRPNALADGTNIRMLRTVARQQALLFQQERQKQRMLGEAFTGCPNALADGTNIRMLRTVVRQQALLFQHERQKHLLFHVPGYHPADALITGLGQS
jgi:hypothetical protein